MKKKLSRSALASTLVAVIALPASVYASLQPIELETIRPETLPVTLPGRKSSVTTEEVLVQVPPIVSATKEIFHSINTGNFEGAINRIVGILGQLGLIDPAHESAAASADAQNPYSNPQTPEEVYDLQRHIDVVRSENGQKLSQIVFGPQAQEALDRQTKAIQAAQQASLASQQGVSNTYQESARQAQQNASAAQNIQALSTRAQSASISQDVLKALAMQNQDLANISAGNSAQLAYLGKAASYQSAQLSAANAQLFALNDKTQVLQVLGASQNYQAAQINAALDRQNHYQQLKDSLQQHAAYQSANSIYIPGLVPKGDRRD